MSLIPYTNDENRDIVLYAQPLLQMYLSPSVC